MTIVNILECSLLALVAFPAPETDVPYAMAPMLVFQDVTMVCIAFFL